MRAHSSGTRSREDQSVAQMLAPTLRRRKTDGGIDAVDVRAPVTTDVSTLCSAASFHVPPRFHELPLPVDDPSDMGLVLLAARLAVNVDVDDVNTKPVPLLCHAVEWSMASDPEL